MKKQIDVTNLKQLCPLPDLLNRVGLGQHAKSNCPSPFNPDQKASWTIFQYQGRWMYKDSGTGELGDEVGLLARINNLDPHNDFPAILKIYQAIVNGKGKGKASKTKAAVSAFSSAPKTKPDLTGFGPGAFEQIEKLSALLGISVEGLLFAQERGVLVFGEPWGFGVYAVKDQSGGLVEARCLDGCNFGASGNLPLRASHVLSGSQLDWPLGILEAENCGSLALVAGCVEFLTLHQLVVQEKAQGRVAPVALLSAATLIAPEALEHFKGKHVRIYPSVDKAGIEARDKWVKQLQTVGAGKIESFVFSALQTSEGRPVNSLCEYNRLKLAGQEFTEKDILP